jgi:hypothetical protein
VAKHLLHLTRMGMASSLGERKKGNEAGWAREETSEASEDQGKLADSDGGEGSTKVT